MRVARSSYGVPSVLRSYLSGGLQTAPVADNEGGCIATQSEPKLVSVMAGPSLE